MTRRSNFTTVFVAATVVVLSAIGPSVAMPVALSVDSIAAPLTPVFSGRGSPGGGFTRDGSFQSNGYDYSDPNSPDFLLGEADDVTALKTRKLTSRKKEQKK